MVIAPTDLKLYYSGTTTKNGPGGPQGGMISTFQVPAQTITGGVAIDNTVFADITNTEAMNGKTRYVCLYLKNTHGSQPATNVKIWQSSITPGQDSIRVGYSGVAANGHDPLLTSTNTSTYSVPLSTSFSTIDDQRKRVGFYVTSQNAPIYGKTITLVEIYMQRVGSPTGTLRVLQRGRTSETIDTDYGSINVATISNTSPTLYQFSDPANTGFVHVEDIFSIEYSGGSSTNNIQVFRAAGSPIQGMHLVTYTGSQWLSVADFDLCGGMYTAGQSSGPTAPIGVSFENPVSVETAITLPNLAAGAFVPFWLRNDVPANTSNQLNNTSELRFRVQSPTP